MDIKYFAGLFDGEGWCRIDHYHNTKRKKPYHRYQLIMGLGMTHYPTIKALHDSFGGYIHRYASAKNRNPKNRISYTWRLWSQHACDLLRRAHPFLITKQEQAALCIEFQDHMNSIRTHFRKHRGRPPDADQIHQYRHDLMDKLSALKQESFDVPKHLL